jgi:acetoin utilization protein AcuB
MFVRNYMSSNPITIGLDVSFPEAMGMLRRQKIRRLPVVDKGKLVGIIVEKDLLSNQPSPATTLSIHEMYALLERLRVRQIMSRPVITVEGDCPVEEAARIMVERKIGCLPVMDGEKLAGIITETDIFEALVEVLGGPESGFRLTLRLPDQVGELARVTARIADAGGNIIAVTSSRMMENKQREVTIKEVGADAEALMDHVRSSETVIVDVRSSTPYQPRLFGE